MSHPLRRPDDGRSQPACVYRMCVEPGVGAAREIDSDEEQWSDYEQENVFPTDDLFEEAPKQDQIELWPIVFSREVFPTRALRNAARQYRAQIAYVLLRMTARREMSERGVDFKQVTEEIVKEFGRFNFDRDVMKSPCPPGFAGFLEALDGDVLVYRRERLFPERRDNKTMTHVVKPSEMLLGKNRAKKRGEGERSRWKNDPRQCSEQRRAENLARMRGGRAPGQEQRLHVRAGALSSLATLTGSAAAEPQLQVHAPPKRDYRKEYMRQVYYTLGEDPDDEVLLASSGAASSDYIGAAMDDGVTEGMSALSYECRMGQVLDAAAPQQMMNGRESREAGSRSLLVQDDGAHFGAVQMTGQQRAAFSDSNSSPQCSFDGEGGRHGSPAPAFSGHSHTHDLNGVTSVVEDEYVHFPAPRRAAPPLVERLVESGSSGARGMAANGDSSNLTRPREPHVRPRLAPAQQAASMQPHASASSRVQAAAGSDAQTDLLNQTLRALGEGRVTVEVIERQCESMRRKIKELDDQVLDASVDDAMKFTEQISKATLKLKAWRQALSAYNSSMCQATDASG